MDGPEFSIALANTFKYGFSPVGVASKSPAIAERRSNENIGGKMNVQEDARERRCDPERYKEPAEGGKLMHSVVAKPAATAAWPDGKLWPRLPAESSGRTPWKVELKDAAASEVELGRDRHTQSFTMSANNPAPREADNIWGNRLSLIRRNRRNAENRKSRQIRYLRNMR